MTSGSEYIPIIKPEIPTQHQYCLYARKVIKVFDSLILLNSHANTIH